MPNLYRDTTRLYWGIYFYRNSLHKPDQQNFLYNDEYFGHTYNDQLRKISIKCYRSKRTLAGIIKSYSTLFKSLTRLKDKKVDEYFESQTKQIYGDLKEYLPSNPIETSELLNQIEGIIEVDANDLSNVINPISFDISTGHSREPMLHLCFWVHRHYEITGHPRIRSLEKIRKRLKNREIRLLEECEYYEKGMSEWQEACERLKDKMRSYRTF